MSESFEVTISLPADVFNWDALLIPIRESLDEMNVVSSQHDQIFKFYGYLLRQQSWMHGIDWNPQQNKVTVLVPNDHMTKSTPDKSKRVQRDGLTTIILIVLDAIPFKQLMKHFENQEIPL